MSQTELVHTHGFVGFVSLQTEFSNRLTALQQQHKMLKVIFFSILYHEMMRKMCAVSIYYRNEFISYNSNLII